MENWVVNCLHSKSMVLKGWLQMPCWPHAKSILHPYLHYHYGATTSELLVTIISLSTITGSTLSIKSDQICLHCPWHEKTYSCTNVLQLLFHVAESQTNKQWVREHASCTVTMARVCILRADGLVQSHSVGSGILVRSFKNVCNSMRE